MVDEELKQRMVDKIEDGSLGSADLMEYMTLFVQVCNESEEVQEECEGWSRKFQFVIENFENMWLTISEKGIFEVGAGNLEEPDITLEMDEKIAADIFCGELDATSAYMNNDLKIIGPLPDAIKFRTLTELVREEFTD